ncbi:jg22897 [Pararge aegeria aegeria]|uniref:Jg22897 protein n=1 Tax=Pararge aegeria aegeria TaxID=348720 RepID=A0A8S4RUX7_9NEOP|nr:jg22897 [Pararge aegeria aegeria]
MRKFCDASTNGVNFCTPSRSEKLHIWHVLRHERYALLQLIMMGKVAGRRGVGRRKKSWLRNIREWTGIASAELFRLAKNRQEFTKLTAKSKRLR